jgi:hypothetical protein
MIQFIFLLFDTFVRSYGRNDFFAAFKGEGREGLNRIRLEFFPKCLWAVIEFFIWEESSKPGGMELMGSSSLLNSPPAPSTSATCLSQSPYF